VEGACCAQPKNLSSTLGLRPQILSMKTNVLEQAI